MDKRLVARIQADGDQAAIEELYRRCRVDLNTTASAVMGNPHDAEEAAHDAFEKVLRKINCFDVDEPAPFRCWLRAIVRRRCLDLLRKRKALEVLPLEALDATRDGLIDESRRHAPSSTSWSGSIVNLLKGLPSTQHEVIALDCLGFETHEIASKLDRTPGAVRILRHRGLRTLRARLAVE